MIGSWIREYAVQLEFDTTLSGVQTLLQTSDDTAVTFGNLKVGISGDQTVTTPKFKLLLNNKADLITASAVKDTPKAAGTSDKSVDDIQITVSEASKFNPEVHAHSNITGLFLSLLAQNGYSETAVTPDSTAVRIGKMVPYVTPAINRYGSFAGIVQKMATSGAPATKVQDSNALIRCALPSSVKLSAEEGGILTLAAEMMGAKWSSSFSLTGTTKTNYDTNAKALTKANLKWQNATVLLLDALSAPGVLANPVAATNAIKLQGFELTLSNNLTSKFYNSDTISSFILGKFTGEGTFTIPWYVPGNLTESYWAQIADFQAGTVKHLIIYWGTAPSFTSGLPAVSPLATGSILIDMFIQYKSGGLEGDDVLGSNMGFSCVQPIDGTPSVTVYCAYDAIGASATKFT